MDQRFDAIRAWLGEILSGERLEMVAASKDASFRRYFRVFGMADQKSLIVMDAPPTQEDSRPFVRVAESLHKAGVNVPEVLAADLRQGFLLLSDLGSVHYLQALAENRHHEDYVHWLYGDAMGALLAIQACASCDGLPVYDDQRLRDEMNLFPDWFLTHHLEITVTDPTRAILDDAFDFLQRVAAEQPRVFVHRDYHSRNLMLSKYQNPGILDFQDAVCGPITYDLLSLLKDVYINWPPSQVDNWVLGYRNLAIQHGILTSDVEEGTWLRWFHLMGVQRHLKVAGIFARLYYRDGKPGYLADIPLTLDYLTSACARYPELAALSGLLDELALKARTQERNTAVLAT